MKFLLSLLLIAVAGAARSVAGDIDFSRDVLPIIQNHCVDCHGPDEQESALRLDSMAGALSGGDSGERVIFPGDSDQSYLIELVASEDDSHRMPPDGERLSAKEINVLKSWIDDAKAWQAAKVEIANRKIDHWSLRPLVRPEVPAPHADQAIDAFIKQKLSAAALEMSAQADRRRLIRRLYLVMHGLPPTPEQVQAFVDDARPDAWSQLVEEVLSSPHYGERLATHWLDLVRFGETHGFETNRERPHAWRYRDWVINAFNTDKPYDDFVIQQIAGDVVGHGIGTGFLVAGPYDLVKGQDPKLGLMQRQDELADMINATGTAFMGLTLGCARCHNHKFDPITQTDYYSMQAVFAGVKHADRKVPPSEQEEQELAKINRKLDELRSGLAKFVRRGDVAHRVLDDALVSKDGGPGVEYLASPAGKGTNPAGTERGFADDPGSADRTPNISGGQYTWWKNVPGQDVAAYRPFASGRFRIWLSWGAGWETHSADARYLIDIDGNMQTVDDRAEIAKVDQKFFSDRSGDVARKALWSGLHNAGVHQLSPENAIVVQCGQSGTAITTDVLLLEPINEETSLETPTSKPRVRAPVNAKLNLEQFPPIEARFVRMTISATNQSQPCIDELEIFSGDQNVALASGGAKATSGGDFVHPLHKLQHINDGEYGNAKSWISKSLSGGWVQIELAEACLIGKVVWGRDRQQRYNDRLATEYAIDVSADGETWSTVASSADRLPYRKDADAAPVYDFDSYPQEQAAQGRAWLAELNRLSSRKKALETGTLVYAGMFSQPGPTHRLYRGEPEAKREEVSPDAIASLGRLNLGKDSAERERRLALANWITSPEHPLTARVIVNRLWQFHFGTGIVDTPSDFGRNGTNPTHPELLDWLAAELIDNGWSIKHIQRLILNSATWQQDSRPNDAGMKVDAATRLLWRFPPRRMEAEAIRDCMLAASGKLDLKMGGPGFSAFEVEAENVRHYHPKQNFGPEDWRRMIYMTKVRQERDAVFGVFDCPDASQVTPKRSRSTTPLQALNLLNSRFVIQQAEFLAQRLEREADSTAEQIRRAYQLCYGIDPSDDDLSAATEFIGRYGLVQFARALLNSNRLVFIT